jgi:hypothetical protein
MPIAAFSRVEFDAFLALAVPYSIALGMVTLLMVISQTLFISLVEVKGCWGKFTSLVSSLFYATLFVGLFAVTLVCSMLYPPENIRLYLISDNLRLI